MNYEIIIRDEKGMELPRKYNQSYFLNNDHESLGQNLYDQFQQLTNREAKF